MFGKLFERLETLMASAAFAEAGEQEKALDIAYPESNKKRREIRKRNYQENRLELHR